MKFIYLAPLVTGALLLSSCSSMKKERDKDVEQMSAQSSISSESVSSLISSWPTSSQKAANSMINKYGLPIAATDMALVWGEAGPFKRTIVYKEESTHFFPVEHRDVIQQFVDYRVPTNKVVDLWRFDGSLTPDRTRGELSVRGDSMEMNILSLNLADEIVRGRLTVDNAKQEFARSAALYQVGNYNQYTDGLNFTPQRGTADPDRPINIRPMRIQAEEEQITE